MRGHLRSVHKQCWLLACVPSAVCDDTGEHSTTRLCLQWLFDRRDKIQGAHVMDYGTGSGVLAVAALLMGAASAVRNCNNMNMEVNQHPLDRYQKITHVFDLHDCGI